MKKINMVKFTCLLIFSIIIILCSFSIYNVFAVNDESESANTDKSTKKNNEDNKNSSDTSEETTKDNKPSCDEDKYKNASWEKIYNASIKNLGSNKYQISINPKAGTDNGTKSIVNQRRNVEFTLISINNIEQNGNDKLSSGNDLTIVASKDEDDTVTFIFENIDNSDPECKGTINLQISYSGGDKLDDLSPNIDTSKYPILDTGGHQSAVNCPDTSSCSNNKDCIKNTINSSTSLNDTEKSICIAKKLAENKNGDKFNKPNNNTQITDDTKDFTYKFKCDSTQFMKYAELSGEKYYTNKKYLYYQSENAEKPVERTYYYHYKAGEGDNAKPKTVAATCSVKCEEGVEVSYGPPVASKAGLCFEYKIKAISNVRCYMDESPSPPTTSSICIPTPECVHKSGVIGYTAGPNEDFDECVNKCDGGKYTYKCSKKCYKKVYGNSSTKTTTLALNYDTSKTSGYSYTVAECKRLNKEASKQHTEYNKSTNNQWRWNTGSKFEYVGQGGNGILYDGCYVWEGSGESEHIVWKTDVKDLAGFYYYMNNFLMNGSNTQDLKDRGLYNRPQGWTTDYGTASNHGTGDGFYRKLFKNSNTGKYDSPCNADCKWTGCSTNQYINLGIAEKDYEENYNTYKKLINECQAAAKCSTSVAYFTISVDYKNDKSTEDEHIDFPYSTKYDSLKTKTKLQEDKLTNNTLGYDTIIRKYDGCYGSNCNTDDSNDSSEGSCTGGSSGYYETIWSFPGSWINLKNGDVTYQYTSDNGWRKLKHKFCIPLNAKNVNSVWFNKYYSEVLGINGDCNKNTSYSIFSPRYNTICKTTQTNSICNITNYDKSDEENGDITYNIHAKTTGFGYYGWDVAIDCFYALNNCPNNDCYTEEKTECKVTSSVKTRSIDLEDVFPNEEGKVNNKDSNNFAKTGRTPGFNWSTYAIISEDSSDGSGKIKTTSTSNMTSNPPAYLAEIQSQGYGIYDGETYLDYSFDLTPSDLKKLKNKVNANGEEKNYTDYEDKNFKIGASGVSRYTSSLFRNGGDISSTKIPNESVLDCNNIQNYKATQCQVFD